MADRLSPLPPLPAAPPRRRRRPLRAAVLRLTVLGLAGTGAWFGAVHAADLIERMSHDQVARALDSGGYDWATVTTDGLQVALSGTAPDEVQRFRAITRAGTVVDARRVIDAIAVAPPEPIQPPEFKVELLRNDAGVSIIGLVPAVTDRDGMTGTLNDAIGGGRVADLLETADHAAPTGWDSALRFGLTAIQAAGRAKVSVAPGQVSVTAITDGPAEKARLESALRRDKPDDVGLVLNISAPRPVISPFTLRMVKDGAGLRFDACAADTDRARTRILDAARAAGVTGDPDCTLGLGVPTPTWADAVVPGIEALAEMDAGTLTYSNADVALAAPASVPADQFDRAVGALDAALPPVFSLVATRDEQLAEDGEPAEFTATVTEDGVTLRGRITDERMREAVESLAATRFGQVDSSLRVDPDAPGGWTVRVIAAIEAMSDLRSGTVRVTPDLIRLTGSSGVRTASDAAVARLSNRLGAGARYELAIRYDERLDPLLDLPTGQECVDALNRIMVQSEIGFDPNGAQIAGDPDSTLQQLAEAAQGCAPFRIEIGGHTDSQGSENFNAELSRSRAQAVLSAMTEAGIPTGNMTVRGYGESRPVDSNETEAGREANRRIEFTLLSDAVLLDEPPPPPEVVQGVTEAAVEEPAPVQGPMLPGDGSDGTPDGVAGAGTSAPGAAESGRDAAEGGLAVEAVPDAGSDREGQESIPADGVSGEPEPPLSDEDAPAADMPAPDPPSN
ncbi:OmpA family protein [uncultured Paracoccus sp.]|uniref:OmpA family protein n=1 Tax=uncultured Paracoccus sp. TaxID=189685 RepID=UPI00261172D2|nr:OmpA family protein [uncultured Paracoccus sp.]